MEERIKLPGSSFEEISKVIQGYASANKPSSLDEISRRIGMHNTVISRNNGFLMSIGILDGGKNKAITPLGKKIGDALSHNIEIEIRSLFREVVDSNEFLKNLVGAVRIRKGMDEGALKAHVAYSAGAPKSSAVMTGTGAIVEILKRAGAIEERDGKLAAVSAQSLEPDVPLPGTKEIVFATGSVVSSAGTFGIARRDGAVSIAIEVQVNCTPDQLDGLGIKIRKVIEDIERDSQLKNTDDVE